ncbi:hypothetical protein AB0B45_15610 [Nonomuraea sp. NPDC049152]|uniref:hypothetical protein n=1 Tax=Nonomuraea sp. NPDC049152 TaxID=3154350 RepID=UPI00340AA43C
MAGGVNALGALVVGTSHDLLWEHIPGKIDAAVLLEFVCSRVAGLPGGAGALSLAADGVGAALPVWRRPRPCTVVLDNAYAHVDKAFKGRRDQLAKIGVELFHLPPRSPELNDIEHQALTRQRTRVRGSAADFTATAFRRSADQLVRRSSPVPLLDRRSPAVRERR